MVRLSVVLVSAMVAGVGLALPAAPAMAETITAQSIWSKENAIARATGQLPAGAVISNSQCQTVEVGMDNERYICTLTYDVPAPAASPAGSGSGGATTP